MPKEPIVRITHEEIRSLFTRVDAAALDKALTTVRSRLRFRSLDYDQAEALRLIEELASFPGALGIVARFAKARLLLRRAS